MQRPKLKISNLTNLQDARYAAAVGFDYVSFNLARGDDRKLGAATVWNIAQWIEGPELVIETNVESFEEIESVQKQVNIGRLSFPMEAFAKIPGGNTHALIFRGGVSDFTVIDPANFPGQDSLLEISLDKLDQWTSIQAFADRILIHLKDVELIKDWISQQLPLPFGFSLQEEVEENRGELNYELIDEFIEWYDEKFERVW